MARKVVNRKQLREESEAAEKIEAAAGKKKAVKKKKTPTKRKSKAAAEVRKKLFWGVYTQGMKRVALYEHNQKKQAKKKAEELSVKGKSQHFVMKVKDDVEK
jgi:hypothetical protein